MPHSRTIDITRWRESIIAFAYSLHQLHEDDNVLTHQAQARQNFMFVDDGIPVPRPATILAWASLCSIGPIGGISRLSADSVVPKHLPYRIEDRPYVLPFLPKLRLGDDTSKSLARNANVHEKDVFDRIRWGSVHVASEGQIQDTLKHGVYQANTFLGLKSSEWAYSGEETQYPVPPLYATLEDGFQFGLYQNLPRVRLNLRDPFEALAIQGIPELRVVPSLPQVRRLLFRFLSPIAAKEWAYQYHEAAKEWNHWTQHEDIKLLGKEIRAHKAAKDSKPGKGGKHKELFQAVDKEMESMGLANLLKGL